MTLKELTVVIDGELDVFLSRVAESTGRRKEDLAHEAIIEFLEDIEDAADADAVLALNEPTIPFAEVLKELGLES